MKISDTLIWATILFFSTIVSGGNNRTLFIPGTPPPSPLTLEELTPASFEPFSTEVTLKKNNNRIQHLGFFSKNSPLFLHSTHTVFPKNLVDLSQTSVEDGIERNRLLERVAAIELSNWRASDRRYIADISGEPTGYATLIIIGGREIVNIFLPDFHERIAIIGREVHTSQTLSYLYEIELHDDRVDPEHACGGDPRDL